MAASSSQATEYEVNYQYWRLWVSDDGATHITRAKMGGFKMVGYSKAPQAVREEGIPEPQKVVFTELPPKFDNPWHHCPASQFVLVTRGSWFVETTDGSRVTLGPQDILYQDNSPEVMQLVGESSVAHAGQHYSGTEDELCQQVIVQVDRPPALNEEVPF